VGGAGGVGCWGARGRGGECRGGVEWGKLVVEKEETGTKGESEAGEGGPACKGRVKGKMKKM